MKALTVWQPHVWAMFNLPPDRWKDIENRTWAAPWMTGRAVCIHAGQRFDDPDAWDAIEEAGDERPPVRVELVVGSIVGVVVIDDFVYQSSSPWFSGPVGWKLGRRWRLAKPVPCSGAQGLWTVPDEIEIEVRMQLPQGKRAA